MPQRIEYLSCWLAFLPALIAGCYESYPLARVPPSPCEAGEPTLVIVDEACVEMTFVPTNVRPLCGTRPDAPERGSGFRVVNLSLGRALVRMSLVVDTTETVEYGEHDPASCACTSTTSTAHGVACFAAAALDADATLEWTVSTGGAAVRVEACPAPDVIGAVCD